jgi:hypothetical protein
MKAYELTGQIHHGYRLEVILPERIPDGEARVIVLLPETHQRDGDEKAQRQYLRDFFHRLDASDRPRMTKEEIDRYIEEERASWGD